MAVLEFRILVLVALSCCVKGQKYFVGEEHQDDFFPTNPVTYYQNAGNYFLPKDLQTSDLSPHLQHTLPQYRQYVDPKQSIPFPFRLASNDYVIPSTHRPDFSQLLPQQRHLNYDNRLEFVPSTFINPKPSTISPTESNKKSTNPPDLRFNKRDSEEELDADGKEEEYSDEPDEEVKAKSDEGAVNKVAGGEDKGDNNDVPEEEYDEEYEYEDEEEDPNEVDEEKQLKSNETDHPEVSSHETTTQEDDIKNNEEMPEYVVSVVTSKTVVNNTVISPMMVNNESSTPTSLEPENTTDSWIVIASVQTSRSISGARYIPTSVVDQEERRQLLNEPTEPITTVENSTTASPTASTAGQTLKTSTESLIDKLDSLQSDLSGILTGGFKNDNIAVIEENLSTKVETTTIEAMISSSKPYPQVNIRKYDPGNRAARPSSVKSQPKSASNKPNVTAPKSIDSLKDVLDKIKPVADISSLLPPGYKLPTSTETSLVNSIFSKAKPINDLSGLLPPGYKPPQPSSTEILLKAKPVDDISALLPPDYKSPSSEKDTIFSKAKPVEDINALLPPGYKSPSSTVKNLLSKAKSVDDISALLPPGYKQSSTTEKAQNSVFSKAKPVQDISALLPPGYNAAKATQKSSVSDILSKAVADDISALLPPGYMRKGFSKPKVTTSVPLQTITQSIPADLLRPGYKVPTTETSSSTMPTATESPSTSSTTAGSAFKVVFPSRPGGGSRKAPRLTTPKINSEEIINNKPTSPTIQKGWPVRASTEFSGWPTPSTTPISIEKLLEAARAAATSSSTETIPETTSTTTTTTTTTTTPKPTTPGICAEECDLAGTIKLVGGAKWMPELLDPNTKEYQLLANSVQSELETIYNNSPLLKKWYTKISIDGFSEGSVLVDYLVEFNEIGKKINTQEIKRLFHESLTNKSPNREGKSLNESKAERLTLGEFEVDPKYTDFIVIPKQSYPTVGYADDVLLPQWAIAVIVIGLASLLFVIIFGVTVLFNRHKNSKKTPAPLTEDMLNELNKNHMGGFDNYGADDFYNMEDVWSDNHYEQKPQKKRNHGSSSMYDNSTANLYDSWRSQWNGQWSAYNNTYYGHANSQHSGHSGFRRPNNDTNF
ncbi:uncharacterized protein [Euwallacea similis]|uniref:uncharacterized protein n=1 Tax=Euwallacea similis TaxID=1736056 RepID=UPI0034500A7E